MKIKLKKENIIPLFLLLSVMVIWIFLLKKYNSVLQQLFVSVVGLFVTIIIPHEIPKTKQEA